MSARPSPFLWQFIAVWRKGPRSEGLGLSKGLRRKTRGNRFTGRRVRCNLRRQGLVWQGIRGMRLAKRGGFVCQNSLNSIILRNWLLLYMSVDAVRDTREMV